MQIGDMKVSAEAFYARTEIYGLSFWSWEGLSAQVIATRVGTGRLPHPVLRKSTAGAVRALTAAGGGRFSLTQTRDDGHYTLALPAPLSDDDLEMLSQLFGPDSEESNPVRRQRGGR